MKKLLLAAMVLALTVGAWAQVSAVGDDTNDTWVRLTIRFKGLEITVTAEPAGASDGNEETVVSGGGTWGAWAAGASGADETIDRSATDVMPCAVVHQVVWVENTGGLTADIDIDDGYTRTSVGAASDGDWSITADVDGWTACSDLAVDEYKFAVEFSASTGSAAHAFPEVAETDMSGGLAASVVDELTAEDPANEGDGTWGAETDQRDMDLLIKCPPAITCTDGTPDDHRISVTLIASVD